MEQIFKVITENSYIIICQLIGIVAMALVFASYQQKNQNTLIKFQIFSSLLFSIHFFMLGAPMGCFLNAVSIFRAYVYSHKETFKSEHIGWVIFFGGISVAAYIVSFTMLETPLTFKNIVLEILPVIAMVALSLGFRAKNSKTARNYSLISCPSWLIYNAFNGSIGGTLSDSFAVISIIIGKIRLDRKLKTKGEMK